MLDINKIHIGDALDLMKQMDDESVDCIITSPPYWQKRDYQIDGQIGLEKDFRDYLVKLIAIFTEAKRVLKSPGTMFINIADSYAGNKPDGITDAKLDYVFHGEVSKTLCGIKRKSLMLIPQRLQIALVDDGWILRNEIIWHKPNVMPSSVQDRFTIDYEPIFFFTKSERYYFEQLKEPFQAKDEASIKAYLNGDKCRESRGDITPQSGRRKQDAINNPTYTGFNARYETPKDGMRNKRCVWQIVSSPGYDDNHFASYPEALVEPLIQCGCPKEGIVLDPFSGSGTTAAVAKRMNRQYIGFELNAEYAIESEKRIRGEAILYTIDDFLIEDDREKRVTGE